jgi:hypothetical protein
MRAAGKIWNGWTQTDGTAKWTHPLQNPQWVTSYTWEVPDRVAPPSNVTAGSGVVDLMVGAQELTHDPNARICPAIGVGGDSGFTVGTPSSVGTCAQNDANGNGSPSTKDNTLSVQLKAPGTGTGTLTLHIGIQDGPKFYYHYRAVEGPRHIELSYSFRGDFAEPKPVAARYPSVEARGVGSFVLVLPYVHGAASGDKVTGSAVISLHSMSGRVEDVALRAIRANFIPSDHFVQIKWKVTASTAKCAAVGAVVPMSMAEVAYSKTAGYVYFIVCEVANYNYRTEHSMATIRTSTLPG